MNSLSIHYGDILQAQRRIDGVAHLTPVLRSRTADELAGAQLHFKGEHLQRAGAFKFRGAFNALSQFSPEQRARGVVTFSSGNHAQAIALAAKLLSIRATIVMPQDAPAIKVAATYGYGAAIKFYDRYTQDRESISQAWVRDQRLTLVPPYDHPHVIAGQGTVAKELFDQVGELDVLLVPLGGGGLLSGCATVARNLYPACRVIGVEPEAGNDGQRSLQSGAIVHIPVPVTIADGAQTQHLGQHTFPIIQQLCDEIVTVSDAQLLAAMKFFAERMKILVEPTGCLAAAAAFNHKSAMAGRRVGIVLSGGNIDLSRFAQLSAGVG